MSNNWRKNSNEYTMASRFKGAMVFRPNSLRQVSAEKELNRLLQRLKTVQMHLENAIYGEPIDDLNRDTNGVDGFPNIVYIKKQLELAEKTLS